MKVAILGAPGSGKSRVANAIRKQLGDDWRVVDKYVDHLQKRTGLPYGFDADFPQNIQVMSARWIGEIEAARQDFSSITCGSIYETLAYTLAIGFPNPTSEAEMVVQVKYIDTLYRFLGAMEDTTADYDLMFYLPYKTPPDDPWCVILDQKIPEILESEFKRVYTLTGTHKGKVNAAFEKIREVQEILAVTSRPAASE
jgi:hypothetical protein